MVITTCPRYQTRNGPFRGAVFVCERESSVAAKGAGSPTTAAWRSAAGLTEVPCVQGDPVAATGVKKFVPVRAALLFPICEVLEDSWQISRFVHEIDDNQTRRCVSIDDVVPIFVVSSPAAVPSCDCGCRSWRRQYTNAAPDRIAFSFTSSPLMPVASLLSATAPIASVWPSSLKLRASA